MDEFHRAHATVELAIRDLKEGAGLEHVPSGHFFANAAWLICAVLAHDLIRWTAMLGEITQEGELTVARTVRTRFLSVPARLVDRSGRPTLRAPLEWPWANAFERAIGLLRALPRSPCSFDSRGRRTADDRMRALTTDANFTQPWSFTPCLRL